MTVLENWQAIIALILLAAVFASFVTERFRPEAVAVAGASAFIALGLVKPGEAIAVFSNPAPITIGALFILSGALVRTGVLGWASAAILDRAEHRPAMALSAVLLSAAAASAFMNNTPVVIVLMPIVLHLARATNLPSSQLLIPLSYAAIMGGTCTLIGTSTNLIVDGVARRLDLQPFGLFEIAPLGLLVVAVGMAFMMVTAPWLLPVRRTLVDVLGKREAPRFVTEVSVPAGSDLIGKTPAEISFLAVPDIVLLTLRRRKRTYRSQLAVQKLCAHDRLTIAAPAEELLALHEQRGLKVGRSPDTVPDKGKQLIEALVAPGRSLAGRRLGSLRLPKRYGVFPLAVHRYGQLAGTDLDSIRLEVGDALLLEASPEAMAELAEEADLLNLSEPTARPLRRRRAPVALATLTGVVALAALNVMPIEALAIIGVAIVLLTGCLDTKEALESMNGGLLLLIFGMLVIGRGVEQSGALDLITNAIIPVLRDAPPLVALAAIYLMASVLTELVTNNAVAVIMTPLAIALAVQLGLDPRPFVVAVMFGSSASFATPIGYQTNTLVYSAGGYRFTDFLKMGLPLNLLIAAVSVFVIPMLWPLQ